MRKMKRLILGSLSLLIVVVTISWLRYDFASSRRSNFSSDEEMISNFHENLPEFDRLVEMASIDSKLDKIAADRNPGLPDDRWAEYRNRLRTLRIKGITSAPDLNGYIFYAETCGGLFSPVTEFCSENGTKGYVYSTTEPSPQFDSLDNLDATKVGKSFVFRKIKTNWYLFFRYPS